jgi:hypothetical protein
MPEMTGPREALRLLQQGGFRMGPDWARAHEICQEDEGDQAHDLVHALCHWIEGDLGNRDYWYRRAGRVPEASIEVEWQALDATLR